MLRTRRNIRLRHHDYSGPGLYAITIVAGGRRRLFSRIDDGQVELTPAGEILKEEWLRIPVIRPRAWLDVFVVMPDHFHGIIGLGPVDGEDAGSLASIIGGFKSICTRRYRDLAQDPEAVLWHRGFYEHWIRGSRQLQRDRAYILANPAKLGQRVNRLESTRPAP